MWSATFYADPSQLWIINLNLPTPCSLPPRATARPPLTSKTFVVYKVSKRNSCCCRSSLRGRASQAESHRCGRAERPVTSCRQGALILEPRITFRWACITPARQSVTVACVYPFSGSRRPARTEPKDRRRQKALRCLATYGPWIRSRRVGRADLYRSRLCRGGLHSRRRRDLSLTGASRSLRKPSPCVHESHGSKRSRGSLRM